MKKQAQTFQTTFERSRPILSRVGELAGILSANEIIYEQSSPPDKSNALAYVTNQDENSDGRIDKIHFVVPNLNKYFNNDFSNKAFYNFLKIVGHILLHEKGHEVDFERAKSMQTNDPFPGGESAADAYADRYEEQLDTMIQQTQQQDLQRAAARLKKLKGF